MCSLWSVFRFCPCLDTVHSLRLSRIKGNYNGIFGVWMGNSILGLGCDITTVTGWELISLYTLLLLETLCAKASITHHVTTNLSPS